MIALGCEIEGTVINSLLSSNVIVKKGAFVKDSVIMSGTVIEEDARVTYAIIDEDVTVSRGAVIGEERTSKKGIAVLGRNIVVEEGAIVGVDLEHDLERGFTVTESGITVVPKGTIVTR